MLNYLPCQTFDLELWSLESFSAQEQVHQQWSLWKANRNTEFQYMNRYLKQDHERKAVKRDIKRD